MNRLAIDNIASTETHINLTLTDGETFSQPVSRHPVLVQANTEQKENWSLSDDRTRATWTHWGRDEITISVFDWVWEALCDRAMDDLKAKDWQMENIPSQTREIVALWRLEADGYNGGFLQFFCNWGEANCGIALAALQTIGANSTYAIVSRQRAILDRLEHHPDLKSYDDIWRLLTREELDEIGNTLDPEFWEVAEEIPKLAALHYYKEVA